MPKKHRESDHNDPLYIRFAERPSTSTGEVRVEKLNDGGYIIVD